CATPTPRPRRDPWPRPMPAGWKERPDDHAARAVSPARGRRGGHGDAGAALSRRAPAARRRHARPARDPHLAHLGSARERHRPGPRGGHGLRRPGGDGRGPPVRPDARGRPGAPRDRPRPGDIPRAGGRAGFGVGGVTRGAILSRTAEDASLSEPERPLVHVTLPAAGPDGVVDGVALVVLDRPEVLNALNFALIEALTEALEMLD